MFTRRVVLFGLDVSRFTGQTVELRIDMSTSEFMPGPARVNNFHFIPEPGPLSIVVVGSLLLVLFKSLFGSVFEQVSGPGPSSSQLGIPQSGRSSLQRPNQAITFDSTGEIDRSSGGCFTSGEAPQKKREHPQVQSVLKTK